MMKQYKIFNIVCVLLSLFFGVSCDEGMPTFDYTPSSNLGNDCIKRSLGPNVVGIDIEFAYAMALPKTAGKLVSAQVEASIAGAPGTWLENNSYYTDGNTGNDVPVLVGNPSVTSGATTTVTFSVDTSAATLRYYYRIPNEARGQNVSFTFSATASNGEKVSYKMGPYPVATMDLVNNLQVTDDGDAYISIADLKVYDAAGAAANPGKIDLVYLYRSTTNKSFEHAFVSPAADTQYRPGISLPSGVSNNSLIRKVYNLQDRHMANLQYGIYVDDPDLADLDLSGMPNYALNVRNEAGLWVQTQDGKYRAYIYVNEVNPGSSSPKIPDKSALFGIKRYTVQ